MSRIAIPTLDTAPAAARPLLDNVRRQFGSVPNLMKLAARSPAVLEGYLAFAGALDRSTLAPALRERVALLSAEFNGCDYCLSAHSYIGHHVAKLDDAEIAAARDGHSADARTAAALAFGRRVLEQRGHVADADLDAVRAAGHDDAQVLELVATVALNVLTNYLNSVAATDIDFPVVRSAHAG